jgi:hypothetical protein
VAQMRKTGVFENNQDKLTVKNLLKANLGFEQVCIKYAG